MSPVVGEGSGRARSPRAAQSPAAALRTTVDDSVFSEVRRQAREALLSTLPDLTPMGVALAIGR